MRIGVGLYRRERRLRALIPLRSPDIVLSVSGCKFRRMNANQNSIEAAPTLGSRSHVRCLVGPVAYDVPVQSVRPQCVPPAASTGPFGALLAVHHHSGTFWETLSYAVLWLCGLIGIGLCFR
jgi:hypothetical protein